MPASSNRAAQYIRMSTDKQDLSPATQREAIAAYAGAKSLEIVASYEDEGRSGVHLKNRPGLLRLLRDVTESKNFSTVLVYDVSRWGRFQDIDAAAYHEYHCRMHGVAVVYVAEMFGAEVNPITAMLKSMKRAMAAEYSRELANKCRSGQHTVVMRGFQLGPLPPLGFRRRSVSADGERRILLNVGQRKLAFTDRIEWVLASDEEVELVQRICSMYARDRLSFTDIAKVGEVEGWRDHKGRRLTNRSVASLVRNEALIGNFVWGRTRSQRSIATRAPSRLEGCLPRLIDDATWALMQSRIAHEIEKRRIDETLIDALKQALERQPLLTMRELRAYGLPGRHALRARYGLWDECLKRIGRSAAEQRRALSERARQHREHCREFGHALAGALRHVGYSVKFGGRHSVLRFPELSVRLRLLWPTEERAGRTWRIWLDRASHQVDFDLLVRLEERSRAKDYFLVPSADVAIRFPRALTETVPDQLARFQCASPSELLERMRTYTQRSLAHQ